MIPCLVLVAAAACGQGHSSAAPTGNGVVPWLDHPAPSYAPPPPQPVSYPASAPTCRPNQVRATDAGGGAATGHVLQRFQFTNTGRVTCLLRGFPIITGRAPSGRRVRLHPRRSGTFFGPLVPADIAPGQHVYLDLGSEDVTCDLAHPLVYRDLTFRLPGGGAISSHAHPGRLCGGWDMSRFGLPPRTTATIPPQPGRLDTLRVSLHVPSSARAATTLRYLVTLTNPTHTPVRLMPCPSYTEAINATFIPSKRYPRKAVPTRQRFRTAAFFLNCGTVHAIAPGQHVRYQMRLAIPRIPPGWAKFGWHLNTPTEPAAATMLTIHRPQSPGGTPTAHVCAASQLRLAYGPEISPKTGQNPRAVRLTNRGPACILHGYPTFQLADANGKLLPFAVADSGDQMVTGAPPAPFQLPSGAHAWIALNKYRCDLGDHQLVSTFQLEVHGESGTATLSSPATYDWGYCGANDPGSTIHVSPFEPTLDQALAHR
jgi:hypothetical protein